MNITTIPRHIEHRNGFDIKFEIRHNFDNTIHWLHFEVSKDGEVVYSLTDESDNEALRNVYRFTDSEGYRDDLSKDKRWKHIVAQLNIEAATQNWK